MLLSGSLKRGAQIYIQIVASRYFSNKFFYASLKDDDHDDDGKGYDDDGGGEDDIDNDAVRDVDDDDSEFHPDVKLDALSPFEIAGCA